ncbi:MAG: hypothetical protein NTW19_06265 [Planctomycetota bacterium]|nr:hypothetical protein [Planctomycetota bacterium]
MSEDLPKPRNTRLVVGAIAFVAACVAFYIQFRPQPALVAQAYYYDLNTGKLFPARIERLPPIAVPGAAPGAEPAGVRAMVFSCGDCRNPTDRMIAWLERFKPAFTAEHPYYDNLNDLDANVWEPELEVLRPGGKAWVEFPTEEGQEIRVVPICPNGSPAVACVP